MPSKACISQENGDSTFKTFHDVNGSVSYRTIRCWCEMIREHGSIDLSRPSGRPRIIRTKHMIQKVKSGLQRKKRVSIRKLASEQNICNTSIHQILTKDLGYRIYKKRIELFLTDTEKAERMEFANWIRHNYRKEDILRILFTDKKMFDLDGMYNAQNDCVWAIDREEANKKGGVKQQRKFPQKVIVSLGACSKGLTLLVILEEGTVDHQRYINKVLPVALKSGNKVFVGDLDIVMVSNPLDSVGSEPELAHP